MTISQLENNPLLHFSGLPKFNEVKAEHVSPAVDYLLADARNTVEVLATADGDVTWDNFASKVEDMEERLEVHEFGGLVTLKLRQVAQDVGFDILY